MLRSIKILLLFIFGFGFIYSAAEADDSDLLVQLMQKFEKFQKTLDAIEDKLENLETAINQKTSLDDGRCAIRDIIDAIRNHKFPLAEEKIIQLADKNKIANIVHDVYSDSPVNTDIILAFAKTLKDNEFQLRVFSALRDEMHSSGQSDPFKLIALVEALEREAVRQQKATPEFKAKVQSVIDNAVEDLKVTSTNTLKAAMISDRYQQNVEIENLVNAIFNFRTDVSNEVMERVVDSVFGVVAAGKIIENVGSQKDIPQVITGLIAIFNRFNFAGNLNNDATLILAAHLRRLQERERYFSISQELRDDVEKVVQQLPLCARNLFFHTYACLWNKGRGEYLYAASSSISHDSERRSIYTWYPGDITTGAHWHVEKIGDDFYFKNRDYKDEYMYAAAIDYNKDMRLVLNWVPGNNTDIQSAWKFELDGDYCYIKSVSFNEYLFAPAVRFDQLNSYVFTWKPGTSVRSAEFQWQVRNCGQAKGKPKATG